MTTVTIKRGQGRIRPLCIARGMVRSWRRYGVPPWQYLADILAVRRLAREIRRPA